MYFIPEMAPEFIRRSDKRKGGAIGLERRLLNDRLKGEYKSPCISSERQLTQIFRGLKCHGISVGN
jgi:hypothetical protein